MKKIVHIIIGWGKAKGWFGVSTAEQKLSDLRLSICGGCKFAKKSSILVILNDDAVEENSLQCTKCHCPCQEKSLVVDEFCPIFRW